MVSWFLGSLVSWFQSVFVSWLQSLKCVPYNHFVLFPEKIHPISKIFGQKQRRIFESLRRPSCPKLKKTRCSIAWCLQNDIMGSPKINNIGLGAQGHVRKSRNHMHAGFNGSPIIKSESYTLKMKQNNPMDLLNISFPQTYH